jgi:glucan 1,6-alpha-isomaltosidase
LQRRDRALALYREAASSRNKRHLVAFLLTLVGCTEPNLHRSIAESTSAASAPSALPFATVAPPLYWTTYEYCYTHDDFIPENVWQKNVDWVTNQLKPLGYSMIVTDGWIYGDAAVNSDGYLTKYNNNWQGDWAYWSAALAQKGLTLGVYYNPLWIQASAYTQNNLVHGTTYTIQQIAGIRRSTGKYEKYWIDPSKPGAKEYVQGYVNYFKSMNVKFLRLDFLSEFENDHGTANYDKILGWIREAAGNNVFLSLVMPNEYNMPSTEVKYCNMMRVSEDSFQGGWRALQFRSPTRSILSSGLL